MRKFLATAVITASFAVAPMANALVIIDNFDTGDINVIVTANAPATDTGTNPANESPNIIGGFHTLTVDNAAGTGGGNGAKANVFAGLFNHSNDTGVSSQSHVLWDANGAGLGGVDITEAGANDALGIEISTIDQGNVTLEFTVIDQLSASSTLILSGLGVDTFSFFFTDFVGSANFQDVDSIRLDVTAGAASDLSINLVQTQKGPSGVPIPGTIALMGLALGGLGAMRRRKAA